jgi:hypothetical protein
MPRRHRHAKGRRGALDVDDLFKLTLQHGRITPEEDARLRETYFEHRDEVLAVGPPGHRPWSWYKYERGMEDRPRVSTNRAGYALTTYAEFEERWLRERGFITKWEERELAKWRHPSRAPGADIELEGDSA